MIGILTFHRGPNYGGFLQAWHLREAVRSLGHEATLINYQGAKHASNDRGHFDGFSVSNLKGYIYHALKKRPFVNPIKDLVNHPLSLAPEGINWTDYRKVIVGSDVVWDFNDAIHGGDMTYYGAHPCQLETDFVAYAPSCGQANGAGPLPQQQSVALRRFSAIAPRDQNTADMVKQATGIATDIVVDPTWLQDDPIQDYPGRPRSPYMLLYGLGAQGARAHELRIFCKKRKLQLIAVSAQCRTADKNIIGISPFHWVDLFRHAQCVVTSTFHGLLYAIKYEKPVVFMARPQSRSKAGIALDRCNLKSVIVEDNEEFQQEFLKYALNQQLGTEIPSAWVNESLRYLKNSLHT